MYEYFMQRIGRLPKNKTTTKETTTKTIHAVSVKDIMRGKSFLKMPTTMYLNKNARTVQSEK